MAHSSNNGLMSLLGNGGDNTLLRSNGTKAAISLLILSLLGAISLQSLFIKGIPLAFVIFYMYEKKEQEIDSIVLEALSIGGKFKSNIARKFLTSKKND